jgi:hypothetical protein
MAYLRWTETNPWYVYRNIGAGLQTLTIQTHCQTLHFTFDMLVKTFDDCLTVIFQCHRGTNLTLTNWKDLMEAIESFIRQINYSKPPVRTV